MLHLSFRPVWHYVPVYPNSRHSAAICRKNGFNLIEAAIVLGVTGLVIGAIWVAAATIQENMKITETMKGVVSTAQNIQRIVSAADGQTIGAGNITTSLISADVFPLDWVSGTTVTHPFGGHVRITNYLSPLRFYFYLFDIPESACIKFTSQITALQANTAAGAASYAEGLGLGEVRIADSSYALILATSTFPITPAQAAATCANGIGSIALVLGYTRTQ